MNALDRFLLGEPIRRQPLREMPNIRTIVLEEYHATMRMAAAASARVQSRFSTAMKRRSAPVHSWPLSGELVSQHADAATYSRMFQLGRDRFLADHSMGGSSIPGRATPVLAMTFTAAVAAEAAMRFGGGTVISVSGVRAQRWLALRRPAVEACHEALADLPVGVGDPVAVALQE